MTQRKPRAESNKMRVGIILPIRLLQTVSLFLSLKHLLLHINTNKGVHTCTGVYAVTCLSQKRFFVKARW